MNTKGLLAGVALLVLIGVGGFLYRAAIEKPTGPIACTADAKLCPDGTGVGREGPSCTFPKCPPPNVELTEAGIAYVLPAGYVEDGGRFSGDPAVVAAYVKPSNASPSEVILIQRYTPAAEQSVAEFIRENAIQDPSGMPAPPTAFSSAIINDRRFSVVTIGRFEGTVDTAYYLEHGLYVFRFDAVSLSVTNWTDPSLDIKSLEANQDLRTLLNTLQGF